MQEHDPRQSTDLSFALFGMTSAEEGVVDRARVETGLERLDSVDGEETHLSSVNEKRLIKA